MTFRVGQKVVCVKNRSDGGDYSHMLVVGEIYTVSLIYETLMGYSALCVAGVGTYIDGRPPGWDFEWFRPVAERKTDISIFTAMLKTERQPLLTEI